MCRSCSRFEVITAHIWRCLCRARGHRFDQPTGLWTVVDFRNRINPELSNKFFGNALIDVSSLGLSGELVTNPLGITARKIREAIDGVNDEYVNSVIDSVKSTDDLSPFQFMYGFRTPEVSFYGNPNLQVISWLGFPPCGLDFGWGEEIFLAPGPGTHDDDGETIILRGYNDGNEDLFVVIRLQSEHVDDFKKFFYQVSATMSFSKL